MAQLSIPQSLIGALIDIADLGTLDYFPPTERCAHWSLYDAQRQELLCPCAPAANTTTEKLFEAAAKILYENFPRYIDSPEEIIPYTSRQELVAALRRGEEEPVDEEQGELQEQSAENTVEPTAEVETSPAEPAVVEDAEVSASVAPKPAAPKPAPSPALFAARAAQAPSPAPTPAPSAPEEAPVEAPAEATTEETVPTPATVAPAAPKPAVPKPAAPKPVAPTPGAPSPGMFRKSTLTYRPPRIEEYLEGLRARQQAVEAAEATHTAVSSEQAPAEELPVLSQAAPTATAPKPAAPKPGAPKPAAPTPSTPATQSAVEPVAAAPRTITTEDRERSYRLRPSLRARLERENISEELVRTILRDGEAERINDWTIRFTHDDYRVDVNTASAEIITVIDEYDADYNEAVQASLAHGEYTSLNALELEFSERARTFLKKNPPFVFDLMLNALSSPESVRMAEGWTRIYAAQGLEIAVSPDERTVLALAKTPDFHVLHAENLRKAQLEELSNTLAKQAEDKAAQAENTTEEEK
ncbi:MAG: DNA repair protein [Rothia mucilaginosa]|uniref:DNA repair protein n=1 Tax=Rothia mucilaginosa TaxID=43675 RepID=A0A930PSC1_9MICC|nr:DNA repair protein [Rothia mucilaginosa]MBF1663936.1 DNA repair protein [Rothia mucilaginosa]